MNYRKNIPNYYNKLFSKYKYSYRSLDWGSRKSQLVRFEQFLEITSNNKFSVLDIGCGLGHFYDFLKKKKKNFSYFGIDINENFCNFIIKKNKKYFSRKNIVNNDFLDHKFDRKFDYVFASGVFYLMKSKKVVYKTIGKMLKISNYGICFNSLIYTGPQELPFKINDMVNYCRVNFDVKIILITNYHHNDFTIILKKK